MIPEFDDLNEPPVKGRNYLVRTVHGSWNHRVGWWPVWGPKHEDAEFIKFEPIHFHLNRYFLASHDLEWACRLPLTSVSNAWNHGFVSLSEPVLRKKVCRYEFPYPFAVAKSLKLPSFQEFHQHFAGTQCARRGGFICPHKGFNLSSVPSVDGVITCPLHGLRIDATTGRVEG